MLSYQKKPMKKFLLATCLFIIVSCSKKEELNKTFIGYLDFDFTNSPTMIPAGEKIISNVKIEFPAGGEINFTGFEIK